MNRKKVSILILLILVVLSGISVYYFYPKISSERLTTIEQVREEFPTTYKDDKGVTWSVFGKYEIALETNYIIIRDTETHREVSRITSKIYKDFSKTLSQEPEGGDIEYLAINDVLKKLIVFVEEPEFRGATGNIGWRIILSDFYGKNLEYLGAGGARQSKGIQTLQFSPNREFMSYLAEFTIGAANYSHAIEIYNLLNKKSSTIKTPRNVVDFIKENNISPFEPINNLISRYRWFNNEVIEFTRYFSRGFEKISPEETWQYNVVTGEYAFVKVE